MASLDRVQLHQQHQQALLSLLQEFDRVCKKLDIPYVLFAGTMLGAVRHQGFIPWDDDLDILMLREDYLRFLQDAESVLDRERFFLQKEFSQHWPMFFSKLRLNHTTCLEKYHPKDLQTHQGIYIDIFPCDPGAKTALGRKIQFLASKVVIAKALGRRGYDTDSYKKKMFIGLCRLLPGGLFLKVTKCGRADSALVHTFLGGASGYKKNVFPRKYVTQRIEMPFEGDLYPVSRDYDALLQQLYGEYMVLPPEDQRAIKRHAVLVDPHHSYEIYTHYRDGMHFDIYTRSIR